MGEVAHKTGSETWSDEDLLGFVQGVSHEEANAPGSSRALELLFSRHHARVHAQCARLLADSGLADDATQDIFLGLLDSPRTREGSRHFSSWLYIVVRNHCLNVLRRRKREVLSDPDEPWAEFLVDPEDPQRDYEDQELARAMDALCDEHLTPRERQVVHLRYGWGLRVKQINEVLGLTNASGARTHLTTARGKLRGAFTAKFGSDGLKSMLGEG